MKELWLWTSSCSGSQMLVCIWTDVALSSDKVLWCYTDTSGWPVCRTTSWEITQHTILLQMLLQGLQYIEILHWWPLLVWSTLTEGWSCEGNIQDAREAVPSRSTFQEAKLGEPAQWYKELGIVLEILPNHEQGGRAVWRSRLLNPPAIHTCWYFQGKVGDLPLKEAKKPSSPSPRNFEILSCMISKNLWAWKKSHDSCYAYGALSLTYELVYLAVTS